MASGKSQGTAMTRFVRTIEGLRALMEAAVLKQQAIEQQRREHWLRLLADAVKHDPR
jgi:alpha-ketoglutarate-dependent taurine dioxygenase